MAAPFITCNTRAPRRRAAEFVPRVKRQLDIGSLIPELKPGMRAAVEYGTAHRAQQDEPIAGKTGTCTDSHTHLGWFGSFNDVGNNKLVVVVLLTGGRPAIGPLAAGVAGEVYRNLAAEELLCYEPYGHAREFDFYADLLRAINPRSRPTRLAQAGSLPHNY